MFKLFITIGVVSATIYTFRFIIYPLVNTVKLFNLFLKKQNNTAWPIIKMLYGYNIKYLIFYVINLIIVRLIIYTLQIPILIILLYTLIQLNFLVVYTIIIFILFV